MNIERSKILIDFMVKYWNSDQNLSHNTEIRIGFYGGEPLINGLVFRYAVKNLRDYENKGRLKDLKMIIIIIMI